jgi:hypothetical protein
MTADRVLDESGFVREGEHVLIVLPAYDAILPLRVKSIVNKEAKWFNYGPVPYTFTGYPEGVMKARSATDGFKFKDVTGRLVGEEAGDMFYHKKPEKLIHAYIDITPHLFRIYQEVPTGAKQIIYLDAVTFTTGVDDVTAVFGYTVGVKEQFFLPNFHIDWFVHNATNMHLRTNVMMKYAEYNVEMPTDADLIFNLMMRKIPAYWWTLPVTTRRVELDRMFEEVYKFPRGVFGLPFYRSYERDRALREIPEKIRGAVI